MMRLPDLVRMAVRKSFSRRRWTVLTILSLSLGVAVFTTATSLVAGLRELFGRTILLDVLDVPDQVITVHHRDPREDIPDGVRERLITRADLEVLCGLEGVVAACEEVRVWPIRIEGLVLDTYDGVASLTGLDEAMLGPYVPEGASLADPADRVPLILGRFVLRSRYDESRSRFVLDPGLDERAFIGREVEIVLGDNRNYPQVYQRNWKDGRFVIEKRKESEFRELLRTRRKSLERRYEMNLFNRVLRIKARIAGIAPGSRCYLPGSIAKDAQRWIVLRNELATRASPPRSGLGHDPEPDPAGDEPGEVHGREEQEEAGFYEVLVMRAPNTDPAAVVHAIEDLGFHPVTRADRIREQMDPLESSLRIIRYVVLAIGLCIFVASCLFIFLTTSKVIADAQTEIGLLRALGATRREIMRIFLMEAGILGVTGTMVGLALGYGVAEGLSGLVMAHARDSQLLWRAGSFGLSLSDVLPRSLWSFDGWVALLIASASFLASMLAGWFPARRASYLDPIQALRGEG